MKTRLSGKGQVLIPARIRNRMNLHAGDAIDIRVEGEQIVLVPKQRRAKTARIIKDRLTGFPVLTAGQNAPVLTSEEVARTLPDFP